jgi:hypothetical protein
VRVSDATLHQRLTAVRLWYDHLVYAGVRERNPVPRGHRGGTGRYEPEHQHQAAALTARTSITRMLEEVQLSPDERAAMEGDVGKLDSLVAKLWDTPALDGQTPREISRRNG